MFLFDRFITICKVIQCIKLGKDQLLPFFRCLILASPRKVAQVMVLAMVVGNLSRRWRTYWYRSPIFHFHLCDSLQKRLLDSVMEIFSMDTHMWDLYFYFTSRHMILSVQANRKATGILVTSRCWWHYVGENFRMLVTIFIWWCQHLYLGDMSNDPSPTSGKCHQLISSPASM